MINTNFNQSMTIYPNQKGWDKIFEIIQKEYHMKTLEEAKEYVTKYRTTKEGGYKEQIWEIISTLGEIFYNGSDYFENAKIIIE